MHKLGKALFVLQINLFASVFHCRGGRCKQRINAAKSINLWYVAPKTVKKISRKT